MRLPFNGSKQIIDLNGSAGALIDITATGPVTRWVVRESLLSAAGAANTPVGLQYKLPGNAQVFALPAASTTNEPGDPPKIEIPDPEDSGFHAHERFVIGMGPDSPGAGVALSATGTVLCSVKSLTAAATSVVVDQIY